MRSVLQGGPTNPLQVLWIDPDQIIHIGIGWGKYNKRKEIGKIKGGNWDRNLMPFDQLDVYQSFKLHFIQGRRWEETSYYKTKANGFARYGKENDETCCDKLSSEFQGYDSLYKEIQKDRFKSKRELLPSSLGQSDEITVRISRDGAFLFEDGRHRLAIAKLLDLEKIPVLVTWRHKNWVKMKCLIKDKLNGLHDQGGLKLPGYHPDLDFINKVDNREDHHYFNMIKMNLPLWEGTLLHIGAEFGALCHMFEDEGFQCYAAEDDKDKFQVMQAFKHATNRKFTSLFLDVHDFVEKSDFDVVLLLGGRMDQVMSSKKYDGLRSFFSRLKTKYLIVEPHTAHNPAKPIPCSYFDQDTEGFIQSISEKTGLQTTRLIGYSLANQPVYMLAR